MFRMRPVIPTTIPSISRRRKCLEDLEPGGAPLRLCPAVIARGRPYCRACAVGGWRCHVLVLLSRGREFGSSGIDLGVRCSPPLDERVAAPTGIGLCPWRVGRAKFYRPSPAERVPRS